MVYERGDVIYIEGYNSPLTFWEARIEPSGFPVVTVMIDTTFRSFRPERVKSNKPKTQPKLCPDHPWYGAKRRPQSDCPICWGVWETKQEKKNE